MDLVKEKDLSTLEDYEKEIKDLLQMIGTLISELDNISDKELKQNKIVFLLGRIRRAKELLRQLVEESKNLEPELKKIFILKEELNILISKLNESEEITAYVSKRDLLGRKKKQKPPLLAESLKTTYDKVVFGSLLIGLVLIFGLWLYALIAPTSFVGGTYTVLTFYLILLLFFFLIGRKFFPTFYQSKAFDFAKDENLKVELKDWFEWFPYVVKFDTNLLVNTKGGFDAVLQITFLRYSAILFGSYSLLSAIILFPINIYGGNDTLEPTNPQYVSGINIITIANIRSGSSLLWGHVVGVYLFSFLAFYYLFKLSTTYAALWREHMVKETIQSRSVMVCNLPDEIIGDRELKLLFNALYTGKVVDAVVARNATKVRKLQKKRNDTYDRFERVCLQYIESNFQKRPTYRRGKCPLVGNTPCIGKKVDAINHFYAKILIYEEKIRKELKIRELKDLEEKQRIKEMKPKDSSFDFKSISQLKLIPEGMNSLKPLSQVTNLDKKPQSLLKLDLSRVGFVVFDSVFTAMQCAQTLHHPDPYIMRVQCAPEPENICWEWLSVPEREKRIRFPLVILALCGLFFFWSIPIAFISALANLNSMQNVPGIGVVVRWLNQWPSVVNVIQGLLSSLALVIFMSLLPTILRAILNQNAFKVRSELDRYVMLTFWLFLFLFVFLIFSLTGSLWSILGTILYNPTDILVLLAQSLPSQALFFSQYITVQGFGNFGGQLARPYRFILLKVKQRTILKTKKEKEEAEKSNFDYVRSIANEMFVWSMAIAYLSISSYLAFFAMLYFILGYIVCKYNFIFVFTPEYEGLKFTPQIIDITTVSIVIYQFTTFAVLSLKGFSGGTSLIIIVLLTIAFRAYLQKYIFASRFVALVDCPPPGQKKIDETQIKDFIDPALQPPDSIEEKYLQCIVPDSKFDSLTEKERNFLLSSSIDLTTLYSPHLQRKQGTKEEEIEKNNEDDDKILQETV